MKKIKQYHCTPNKEEGIVLAIAIIFGEIAIALISLKFGLSTLIWILLGIIILGIIVAIAGVGTNKRTDEINDLILSVYQEGYAEGYIDCRKGEEPDDDIIMI